MPDICGHTDRFYYEKGWWRRWCPLAPGHTGSHFEEAVEPTEEDMFATLRAARNAANAPVDLDAEVAEPVTITKPGFILDPSTIKRVGPKKLIAAAVGANFTVTAMESETLTAGAQFKSGANAGLFRPDKAQTHLIVNGILPGAAAFSAAYLGGSFKDAFVWDVAGWPTELFFDYAPTAEKKKELSEQHALQQAAEYDYRYNDGTSWVNMGKRLVSTATEFDEWLADVIPGYVGRKKKTPADPDLVLSAPMASGSWSAE